MERYMYMQGGDLESGIKISDFLSLISLLSSSNDLNCKGRSQALRLQGCQNVPPTSDIATDLHSFSGYSFQAKREYVLENRNNRSPTAIYSH